MMDVVLEFEDGRRIPQSLALPLSIGRDEDSGLRIRAWRVARRHACIMMREGEVWIEDFGSLAGTEVNGRRVALYGPLDVNDEIVIGPCLLRVLALPGSSRRPLQAPSGAAASGPVPGPDSRHGNDPATPMSAEGAPAPIAEPHERRLPAAEGLALRRRLHDRLIEALQLRRRDIGLMSDEALRAEAAKVLSALIAEDETPPPDHERGALVRDLLDEAVGLGPLEALLADPEITEIMVNRHDEIFIEARGRLRRHPRAFSSEQAVLGVIERIVAPLGRRIDDSSPMVDARLRDGSRVNAVIAPIALRGASLTIRKFPARRLGMADLLAVGALDASIAEFLQACVRHKKNLIVSGGTGSGKTSLLNILSNAIPEGERVVTIEDAAELRLNHQHLVSLEARPANLEGRGRIEIRDLVRNALRMRPDRIVVGECRGGEAFDMLAAMNTGHEGSLTTLHANSPRDALGRLETMILMAGMDLPLAAVREHVASSIDVIVQLSRTPDGRRMVSSVVELTGMEGGRIQLQELFHGQAGPPALYAGCGILPDCFAQQPHAFEASLFSRRTVCEDGQAAAFGESP